MSGGKRARAVAWGWAAALATEVVDDDALGRRLLRAREALRLDPDLVADEELLRVGGRHALAQLAVLVLRLLLVRALRRRAHLAPLLAEHLLDVVRVELGVRRLHLLLALRREHVVRLLLRPRVLALGAARAVEAHDLRAAVLEHLVRGVRRRRRHPVEAVDELRPPPARAPLLHVDVAELGRAHRAGHERRVAVRVGVAVHRCVLLVRELERDEGGAARRRRGGADDGARAQPGPPRRRRLARVKVHRDCCRDACATRDRRGRYHGGTGEGVCGPAARNYGGAVVYFGARMAGVLAPRGVGGSGGVSEGMLVDIFLIQILIWVRLLRRRA